MAINNQYQKLLRSKIIFAVEQANAVARLNHQGVKGTILEILVGQLFEPLLPSDIGVGTGLIIDSYSGEQSGQIDIILYDKSILPPILIDQRTGIFPIESVLYAIEVKTTLNAQELKKAHKKAKKIATKFGYRPGRYDDKGVEMHHEIEKVRSVVFALNSDLSGKDLNEAKRYRKIYGDGTAYLNAICVAGKEYWFNNGNYWIGFNGGDKYDEILSFMGGVTNTYRSVSLNRGFPRLGNYIIPDATECLEITKSRDFPSIKVKCEDCSLEGEMIPPKMGKINITTTSSISPTDPCPSCGGNMCSEKGTFIFKNGVLVESTLG